MFFVDFGMGFSFASFLLRGGFGGLRVGKGGMRVSDCFRIRPMEARRTRLEETGQLGDGDVLSSRLPPPSVVRPPQPPSQRSLTIFIFPIHSPAGGVR